MKKFGLLLITLLLAISVSFLPADAAGGYVGFQPPIGFSGNFTPNQFTYIQITGVSGNGKVVPKGTSKIDVNFVIAPPASSQPFCSFWFASDYANPQVNFWSASLTGLLYDFRGRAAGGLLQINPAKGGVWVMSTCAGNYSAYVYGYSY